MYIDDTRPQSEAKIWGLLTDLLPFRTVCAGGIVGAKRTVAKASVISCKKRIDLGYSLDSS